MSNNGKHPGGRPPKWTEPADVQAAIDKYFQRCEAGTKVIIYKRGEPYDTATRRIPKTVAGLTLALGFTSRNSLLNYQCPDPDDPKQVEIMRIITRAKVDIEQDNVEGGMLGDYESRITGLNLASNYGYSIKSEVSQTGTMTIQVVNYAPPEAPKQIQAEVEKCLP